MTFEERLAALGVDLSDMPKVHSYEKRFAVAKNIFGIIDKELINRMNRACDLIDIIDRMETRLVNVTGERDYLIRLIKNNWEGISISQCDICKASSNEEKCWRNCEEGEGHLTESFEIGVPDEWSVDE